MSTRILSVIALTTLLGACASTSPSAPLSAQSLQHHHWVLEKIDGVPLPAEKGQAPDLEIGEHLRANGSAGCNRYFGQVEVQGTQLRIKQMASTMMFCPPPRQDWERAMTSTLSEWSEATLSEQQLRLKGPQHELQFKLQDWVR